VALFLPKNICGRERGRPGLDIHANMLRGEKKQKTGTHEKKNKKDTNIYRYKDDNYTGGCVVDKNWKARRRSRLLSAV
jgi:hypothetical protein